MMKTLHTIFFLCLIIPLISIADSHKAIISKASGEVVDNITARGTGGTSPFDGTVDNKSDLDGLVKLAWGDGWLGLHRGHAPIEEVLKAFLGISHEEMHVLMEDHDLNLAKTCEYFGFEPENLIASLTASFVPLVKQGTENGVINADEVETWVEKIQSEFRRRVYWEG
ncbi:hypothetical protein [Leucothrix pacifica]|uniref:Uncharacterized protein n=1 Tax=Leucothrix pacifica TaxID=1247513 RepID=A0A317C2C0_9GAMM|nr:hypothetical protein [Leucothrix pacifica]PWQ92775.1 hypothetical protein DKW60_19395 [Leucothrix pacifica]